MANVRNLKAVTIKNYFSAFCMLHLVKGHYNQELRADIVTQLIKRVKNGDQIKDMIQNKQTRQPITIGIMAKLKESIHNSKNPLRRKRLIWFAATTCLVVVVVVVVLLFRIHKVLPKEKNLSDRSITLKQQDVKLTQIKSNGVMNRAITVHLKNPKEDKSKHRV